MTAPMSQQLDPPSLGKDPGAGFSCKGPPPGFPLRRLAGSPSWSFLLIFTVAFVLRLGMLNYFPKDQIPPNPSWETGAVAISLAETGRMADPYIIPTGPTAHMPPLMVAAMGLLYRVLGTGYVGGMVRWILIMAGYSTLFALLPWLGHRFGLGGEAGLIGGLIGALALGFPGEVESFSGIAMALILVAFLNRWTKEAPSSIETLLFGLVLGGAFHLQPALLPVVLGCISFEVWPRRTRSSWASALIILGILIACLPWGIRNYRTFEGIFFVRSNFGLEMHVGNHEGAHPDVDVSSTRNSFRHPRTDVGEAKRIQEIGERPYMKEKGQEALDWIRNNPGEFLKLTAMRTIFFWTGPFYDPLVAMAQTLLSLLAFIGLVRSIPAVSAPCRAVLTIPLLTYPAVYYVVAFMPRYGQPIRWLLLLLAGKALWNFFSTVTRRRRQPG